LSDCKTAEHQVPALAADKILWKVDRYEHMANTKSITDKAERKKVKRAARKKAAPTAKRDYPRGSQKQKVKKLARGQSKR